MIEEITSPPFLDDTAQEMVTKLQAIANNINNNAGQVSYSNTTSQLQAETVQTAIDEVKGITDNINASLTNKQDLLENQEITATPSANGIISYTFPKDVIVQSAVSTSVGDMVVMPYRSTSNTKIWYFVIRSAVGFNPYTSSITIKAFYFDA